MCQKVSDMTVEIEKKPLKCVKLDYYLIVNASEGQKDFILTLKVAHQGCLYLYLTIHTSVA